MLAWASSNHNYSDSFAPFLPQRYQYYVTDGVSLDDLPSIPDGTEEHVHSRILPRLLKNPDWRPLRENLWKEIKADYRKSWQKSIVDYVLMDSCERDRLRINSYPHEFPQRVIRAPVPWHGSFHEAKEAQTLQLFITNSIMRELDALWRSK